MVQTKEQDLLLDFSIRTVAVAHTIFVPREDHRLGLPRGRGDGVDAPDRYLEAAGRAQLDART